ncbi:MAG: type I-U CRISPR-associated protein Csb2 [Candidatus Ozemobacteraceae bacterium]
MIVIELRFPGGRFHATPWGRNVNEGVPEWPPSPWRLTRAVIDVWRRRRLDWPTARLVPILALLSGRPRFSLPAGRFAHTRSWLSSNKENVSERQKIFDAFVVVDRSTPLLMGFEGDLIPEVRHDLADLLSELNFLGRSESWVEAGLVDSISEIAWNCSPLEGTFSGNDRQLVQVACLRSAGEYAGLLSRPQKTVGKRNQPTVELDWPEAIQLTTTDLLRDGWNQPPAMTSVDYTFPRAIIEPTKRKQAGRATAFCWARYSLESTVLPRVLETLEVAERLRRKLMGIDRRLNDGDPAKISCRFSGKSTDGCPAVGHEHAFFLPVDEDRDGRLDHIYVKVNKPFEHAELRVLDRCRSLWQPRGRPDVTLVLSSLLDGPPLKGKCWRSSTPFVTGRHYRKGRGTYEEWLADEVRRECHHHGLPEPVKIEIVGATVGFHPYRWFEFRRSRKKEALRQGFGFALTFAVEVPGPFALGSGCHYGLGLFTPE